jgi:hypothetical protein
MDMKKMCQFVVGGRGKKWGSYKMEVVIRKIVG